MLHETSRPIYHPPPPSVIISTEYEHIRYKLVCSMKKSSALFSLIGIFQIRENRHCGLHVIYSMAFRVTISFDLYGFHTTST